MFSCLWMPLYTKWHTLITFDEFYINHYSFEYTQRVLCNRTISIDVFNLTLHVTYSIFFFELNMVLITLYPFIQNTKISLVQVRCVIALWCSRICRTSILNNTRSQDFVYAVHNFTSKRIMVFAMNKGWAMKTFFEIDN